MDGWGQVTMPLTFESYWSTLIAAGWCEARSEGRTAELRERLERVWRGCPAMTVYELGMGVSYHEDLLEPDFLGGILRGYAEAAEGLFAPTDAATAFPARERVLLSFVHQGRRFSREAPYYGGEVEPVIDALCNEALEAASIPYRFFPVTHADLYAVALVRPATYEDIKRRGWLHVRALPGGNWGAILEGVDDPVLRVINHVRGARRRTKRAPLRFRRCPAIRTTGDPGGWNTPMTPPYDALHSRQCG